MSRGLRVGAATVLATLLVACAGQADDARSDDESVDVSPEEDAPLADDVEGGDPGAVEEVFAAIAAMDLSYEERLEYLHERAVEEGGVLHYSHSGVEMNEAWSAGFSAAYPEIDHDFVRLQHTDLLERVRAEARAGRSVADVIQISSSIGAVLLGEELVAPHHGVPVPEGYPHEFVDDHGLMVYRSGQLIAWNTDLVPSEDAPREMDDLLEPEHSGCVFSGAPTLIATMIVERGYEATEEWLQAFVDNGGISQAGSTSGYLRQLAAGEFPCMINGRTDATEALIADGAPLEWHAPDPTPVIVANVYINPDTTRPHAAALLMHWLASKEAAPIVAEEGRLSPYPDVPLRFERLQPFVDPASELGGRLRPLTSDELVEVEDQVLELIERYVVADPDS